MKKLIAILTALVMCISLVACGGSEAQPAPAPAQSSAALDKQDAIDAFNKATDVYDALVDKMNAEIESYPAELIEVMNEMADAMIENKEILESDLELTEENIKEMISAFAEVEKWATETDAELDDLKIQMGDKSAVIDTFNKTSTAFDAMAAKINANAAAYPKEVIDVMVQMANALIECKTLLESDAEFTAEQAELLMSNLKDIKAWVAEAEAVIVEDTAASSGGASKQEAIEAFNAASGMFNVIAAEINANIDLYEEEFVDGMIELANALESYKTLLESGAELSKNQINEIIEASAIVMEWALEVESEVFG